jgi:hypothetical protein
VRADPPARLADQRHKRRQDEQERPKELHETVTLPAVPPRCRLTFQRAPCVVAMATTTPITTEATLTNSARKACHASRFAEWRFSAVEHIL